MLALEQIKERIEKALPGAKAEILDPRMDGKHLKAVVTYDGFRGKPLLEQHRMVMGCLQLELKTDQVHA
jgi:stress-induced morphogen